MERLIDGERRLRREYSADFKEAVVQQTRERGASVSGVALSHGLHPNMVHRWLREQRLSREQEALRTPAFVALPLEPTVAPKPVVPPLTPAPTQASSSPDVIRVEIQRSGATVTMQWPVTAAAQCAQALRELLR